MFYRSDQNLSDMKSSVFIAAICLCGVVNAQSESKTQKKFERFENGELIEEKYYLEENGEVIQGEDFDIPELHAKEQEMEAKMAEMDHRMKKMQQKSEEIMRIRMKEMDQRMKEMQQRSIQMRQEMELKMHLKEPLELEKDVQKSSIPNVYKT